MADRQATINRNENAAFLEKNPTASLRRITHEQLKHMRLKEFESFMITVGSTQLWVRDQQEALDFYTRQVGWVVRNDVTMPEMANFRWLTVGPEKQPDISIVLMAIPGEPVMDQTTAEQLGDLMRKGFAATLFLETNDLRATYAQLKERGVEFEQEPTQQPYGLDAAFRDPSGNNLRIAQLHQPT